MNPRVVLGVCGGIAAYKAVEVLRGLAQRGAQVEVALTRGAREFVAPMTFAVLSGRPVRTEVWEGANAAVVGHVWSVFIGFRGGRGVATGAGGMLVLAPLAVLAGVVLLAGRLPSYPLKQVAQEMALAVARAHRVRNDVDVVRPD